MTTSFTDEYGRRWTACHECNRGGRGNAKDKCACGWRVTKPCDLGCFIGEPIIGEPVKPPQVSRAKERYRRYLAAAECFESFGEFLKCEGEQ
jgi:hypothetical protein